MYKGNICDYFNKKTKIHKYKIYKLFYTITLTNYINKFNFNNKLKILI